MAFLLWGSRPRSLDLGPAGVHRCPNCGLDRPFKRVVEYQFNHLYYVLGFVSAKRYRSICTVCGQGDVVDTALAEQELGGNPIPKVDRFGCLAGVAGLLALVLALALLRLTGPPIRNIPDLLERAQSGGPEAEKAMAQLRAEAAQDDVPSQEALIDLLLGGRNVAHDSAEAFRWARRAAELGNARAQHTLGFLYESGKGTAVDYAEAKRWYGAAEAQGVAASANSLGALAFRGLGGPLDKAEGARWFRKAADAGYAPACFNLAMRYLQGDGVAADPAEARRLLEGFDFTEAQRRHVEGLIDEWERTRARR